MGRKRAAAPAAISARLPTDGAEPVLSWITAAAPEKTARMTITVTA